MIWLNVSVSSLLARGCERGEARSYRSFYALRSGPVRPSPYPDARPASVLYGERTSYAPVGGLL